MNAELVDKLSTERLNKEDLCHGSLDSFMANALLVISIELQTMTVHTIKELNRDPIFIKVE